jgi:methionine synthase II (cobalamin-independent)
MKKKSKKPQMKHEEYTEWISDQITQAIKNCCTLEVKCHTDGGKDNP